MFTFIIFSAKSKLIALNNLTFCLYINIKN
jgi:hypothetical protein